MRECHFEEAAVLRAWELDLKAQLVGPACDAAPIARIDVPEIEAVWHISACCCLHLPMQSFQHAPAPA